MHGTLCIAALVEGPGWPITDPVTILAVVLAAVLLLPLLGRLIRVPDMILLILAGMALGPFGIRMLARDATMEMWGSVGLLYIMFLAGLEIDVQGFKRYRGRSVFFGLSSFLVPFVPGALLSHFWLGFAWPKAILLASMLASYTLLTYPQVSRLGLVRKESVIVTVGGTLITDTLALLVLAVIAESARASLSLAFALRLAVSFAVFLAVILYGMPRLGRWFFGRVGREGGAQFLFVLLMAFLAGSLSRLAGVEPIIGAFLAGLTMNRLVPPQSALMNRVEFLGRNLFIPFFLLSVGMLLDPRVLAADRLTWIVGGFMTVTVTVTKYLAALVVQRSLGYSSDECGVMFGLSVTQAAATLAAVMVGVQLEIFDPAVLRGTLMMIFVTCLYSPWVTERYARRVALAETRQPLPFEHESRRLLVPMDNPVKAEALTELALLLRDPDVADPIHPLHVLTSQDVTGERVAVAERLVARAIGQAAAADVAARPTLRIADSVAEGIRRAIAELRIATVLMGWTQQGTMRAKIFGGVLDDVLAKCPTRTVVCHLTAPLSGVRRIVVAAPPHAEREAGFRESLRLLHRLAMQLGAEMEVLCASGNRDAVRETAEKLKTPVKRSFPDHGSWNSIRKALIDERGDDAMLAVLAARQGSVSWSPGIDRLPQTLLGRRVSMNVLFVYPAPADAESEPVETVERNAPADFVTVGGVCVAAGGETLDSALSRVLESFLPARAMPEVRDQLKQAIDEFAIPVAKDVVLLHAHTAAVESAVMAVALHPAGWAMPGHLTPRIVLVLLGPQGGPPDRHLQILAVLARLLRTGTLVERLLAAENEDALRRIVATPPAE